MNNDKILEQFHYFNIQSGIDSVYGNWAVSEDGDVVNYLYPFVIFSIHLNDSDWLSNMKQKCWFHSDNEVFFVDALKRAKIIVGKTTPL